MFSYKNFDITFYLFFFFRYFISKQKLETWGEIRSE